MQQSMNQQFNFPSMYLQCVLLLFLDTLKCIPGVSFNPLAQSVAFYVNLYMNGSFNLLFFIFDFIASVVSFPHSTYMYTLM